MGSFLEVLGNLYFGLLLGELVVVIGFILGDILVIGSCYWKCVCYGIGNFVICIIVRI